jgi:hypothetical protein
MRYEKRADAHILEIHSHQELLSHRELFYPKDAVDNQFQVEQNLNQHIQTLNTKNKIILKLTQAFRGVCDVKGEFYPHLRRLST